MSVMVSLFSDWITGCKNHAFGMFLSRWKLASLMYFLWGRSMGGSFLLWGQGYWASSLIFSLTQLTLLEMWETLLWERINSVWFCTASYLCRMLRARGPSCRTSRKLHPCGIEGVHEMGAYFPSRGNKVITLQVSCESGSSYQALGIISSLRKMR